MGNCVVFLFFFLQELKLIAFANVLTETRSKYNFYKIRAFGGKLNDGTSQVPDHAEQRALLNTSVMSSVGFHRDLFARKGRYVNNLKDFRWRGD